MANTAPQPADRPNGKRRRSDVVSYVIQMDQNGQYYRHPQRGRIEVVTLHCNCGRSILVDPKEVSGASVVCSRCNSPFRWQQLTFSDL